MTLLSATLSSPFQALLINFPTKKTLLDSTYFVSSTKNAPLPSFRQSVYRHDEYEFRPPPPATPPPPPPSSSSPQPWGWPSEPLRWSMAKPRGPSVSSSTWRHLSQIPVETKLLWPLWDQHILDRSLFHDNEHCGTHKGCRRYMSHWKQAELSPDIPYSKGFCSFRCTLSQIWDQNAFDSNYNEHRCIHQGKCRYMPHRKQEKLSPHLSYTTGFGWDWTQCYDCVRRLQLAMTARDGRYPRNPRL